MGLRECIGDASREALMRKHKTDEATVFQARAASYKPSLFTGDAYEVECLRSVAQSYLRPMSHMQTGLETVVYQPSSAP